MSAINKDHKLSHDEFFFVWFAVFQAVLLNFTRKASFSFPVLGSRSLMALINDKVCGALLV